MAGQGCETRFSQLTFSMLCFVMCGVGDSVRLLALWTVVVGVLLLLGVQ